MSDLHDPTHTYIKAPNSEETNEQVLTLPESSNDKVNDNDVPTSPKDDLQPFDMNDGEEDKLLESVSPNFTIHNTTVAASLTPSSVPKSTPKARLFRRLRKPRRKEPSVRESMITNYLDVIDTDKDGVTNENEIRAFVRTVIKEQRNAKDTRRYLYITMAIVILLAVSNIGTAYLAVDLAKDTEITSSNRLVAKNSEQRIGVLGEGVSLDVEMTRSKLISGERHFCVPLRDWASVWYAAESGSNTGLIASDAEDSNYQLGLQLKWQGAEQDSNGVCFPTDGDGKVCIDYNDNACMSDDTRRLISTKENGNYESASIRRDIFQTYLKAFRKGEDLKEYSLLDNNRKHQEKLTNPRLRSLKMSLDEMNAESLVRGTFYTEPRELFDVVIIGAGWAGLGAASSLKKADGTLKLKILEANDYVGGRSHTEYFDNGTIPVDLGSEWITYFNYYEEKLYEILKEIPDQCSVTENVETYGLTEVDEHSKHRFFFGEGRVPDEEEEELVELWSGRNGFRTYSWKRRGKLGKKQNESYLKILKDYEDEEELDEVETNFLDSETDSEITTFYGADLEDVQIKDAPLCEHAEMLHMGGSYSELATSFAKCDKMSSNIYDDILLNSKVTKIESRNENSIVHFMDSSDGEEKAVAIYAKHVIVTVSLGVLKSNSILFDPPLPEWKQNAIDNMQFGVLDKVIMYWKDDVEVPWTEFDNEVWYSLIENSTDVNFKQFFNEHMTNGGHQILTAFVGGEIAIEMEDKEDSVIIEEVMLSLKSMFPNDEVPYPDEYKVTRWSKNENFQGSYTSPSTNLGQYSNDLGKRVGNLYFAGEATAGTDWYGSTSGAFLSGQIVADEII